MDHRGTFTRSRRAFRIAATLGLSAVAVLPATVQPASAAVVARATAHLPAKAHVAVAGSTYHPILPVRLLARTPIGPAAVLDVQVTGGTSGIPTGASAVTMNLTGVAPTVSTYLQVYPVPAAGSAFPGTSNLNLAPAETAAAAVQTGLSASGALRIRNSAGTVSVIVDVSGYFTADATGTKYRQFTRAVRAFDGTVAADLSRQVRVTFPGGPPSPLAVVLNVTVDRPTRATYVTAVPPGFAGEVSTVNVAAGATRANLTTIPVFGSNTVQITNRFGTARVVVDVVGYYDLSGVGDVYYPLDPVRFLDTRDGTNTPLGSTAPLGPGQTLGLQVGGTTTPGGAVDIPANADAVVLTVTAVKPSAPTWLCVTAKEIPPSVPRSSSLNTTPGHVTSNLAISWLNYSGWLDVYNAAGTVAVVGDLAGYYVAT